MALGKLAGAIGKGLFAGLAGTAVMTLSSTIEMKLRGREGSDAPVQAVSKVLGIEAKSEEDKKLLSTLVHWDYGTSWGAVRGVLGAMGLRGATAAGAHFAIVWGTALVMLPSLGVAPPVSEWGEEEIAIDAGHHLIYAIATSLAYEYLDRE